MKNLNEYLESLNNLPPQFLKMCVAYFDFETKTISSDMLENVVTELNKEYSFAYLRKHFDKATPYALKHAKKSLKGFLEHSIHTDTKSGAIDANAATMIKNHLPAFLTHKQTLDNDIKSG